MESTSALCPSARCAPGAILLGVVQADGIIRFIDHKVQVDEQFSQLASQGRAPEKRFRFADHCLKSGCRQWTGKRCGIIDQIHAENPKYEGQPSLPACSIRSECRWYLQSGEAACQICPQVITNLTEALGVEQP